MLNAFDEMHKTVNEAVHPDGADAKTNEELSYKSQYDAIHCAALSAIAKWCYHVTNCTREMSMNFSDSILLPLGDD